MIQIQVIDVVLRLVKNVVNFLIMSDRNSNVCGMNDLKIYFLIKIQIRYIFYTILFSRVSFVAQK